MKWEEELEKILKVSCSDSNVEDFIHDHPDESDEDIWNFVYEYNTSPGCKGCKHVGNLPWYYPCVDCLRRKRADYYEKRED